MNYKNRFDTDGKSQRMGINAEDAFEAMAQKRGIKIEKASLKQQYSHIDFIIKNKNNKNIFIDVKSCKKRTRSSSETSEDVVWIELKNVAGNNGWLYGSADYIAFERDSDFVIAPVKPLQLLCERIINKNKKVEKPNEAMYSIYNRKGRKDEISLIKMQDIIDNMKTYIWSK